jgi:hypothetical protein
MSDQELHDYLLKYGWEFKFREDLGFNIYWHKNFVGYQFTLNKAYDKMEKDIAKMPLYTFKNDAEGIEGAKNLLKSMGVL